MSEITIEDNDADGWAERITTAEKASQSWWKRCEEIKKIYADKRRDDNAASNSKRMNILWSNIQTIAPVLYSRLPIPVVVGKPSVQPEVAFEVSNILKKTLDAQIREYDFDSSLKNVALEYLLTSRGTGWIAYEPEFKQVETQDIDEEGNPVTQDVKVSENTYHVFVNYKDFLTSKAKVWEEVTWVARGLDMTKRECQQYFPELYAQGKIIFGEDPKLRVWEVWDKESDEQIFVSPDCHTKILKRGPAPIKFDNFFPCPKPLYSNLDNENLLPTPDYAQYQDQANDLNKYTNRLSRLGDAIKVRGVYQAGTNNALATMFDENMENIMTPTSTPMDNKSTPFQFVPLDIFAAAAAQVSLLRNQCKQDIYELTGISDIVRGASNPNETATAQNIKNQWGGLRIKDKQKDIQRYIRDVLRLKAEVIAELYDAKTLLDMTGMQLTPQAEQLMRDDVLRKFSVDVETDSTIEPDAEQDKKDRTEFLGALAGYLETALTIGKEAPTLVPMLSEMVMFGIKAFPIGNELELKIKQSLGQLVQQQAQAAAQPPKPDFEMQDKMKQTEIKGFDAQTKRMSAQADAMLKVEEIHSDAIMDANDKKHNSEQSHMDRQNAPVQLS